MNGRSMSAWVLDQTYRSGIVAKTRAAITAMLLPLEEDARQEEHRHYGERADEQLQPVGGADPDPERREGHRDEDGPADGVVVNLVGVAARQVSGAVLAPERVAVREYVHRYSLVYGLVEIELLHGVHEEQAERDEEGEYRHQAQDRVPVHALAQQGARAPSFPQRRRRRAQRKTKSLPRLSRIRSACHAPLFST